INYCKLNIIIKKNNYSLSLIDKILKKLDHTRIFIKLNIQQVFHHIQIKSDSENLIIFQIRYEIYKYRVLLFNLINRFVIFQKYMNNIFMNYLDLFFSIYLNDILIYSEDELKHQTHIVKILDQLQATEFQANIKKYEFHVIQIKYLDFIINIDRIEVNFKK